MNSAEVVRRFEHEFKNENNLSIVDELISQDFVHNLPYPGLPPGRQGMKAVGELVAGAFRDIEVEIDLLLQDGELVADRITARGVRAETGEPTDWVENHIYRVVDERIVELWPAGGPTI